MDATKALQWQVSKITIAVLVGIGIVLGIVFKTESMPLLSGLLFGGMIGLLTFRLLGITMEKSMKMPPARAQAYVSAHYFIRMAIIGCVMFISVKVETLNIFTTALGIISVKAVIYGLHVSNKSNSGKKNPELDKTQASFSSDNLTGKEESH